MSFTDQKPTRAPDPRPARTRAAIIRAVETLGATPGQLNVSNIVKEAGLSRSSFYSQFSDVSDIAVQMIRGLLDELSVSQDKTFIVRSQHIVDAFLDEIDKHRHLYAALLGRSADSAAQKTICDMLTEAALPSAAYSESSNRDDDQEFVARFLVAGALASAVDWITAENPVPLNVMKRRIQSITADL